MKTAVKVIAGLLSIVLILIAGAALLLMTMVHSHWLKDQISDYAKAATGRNLEIKGDLHASFWPRLGITADEVSLSNPSGFSDEPFLNARHLIIDAELLPLLHRQLIINHASLREAVINLQKNAKGQSNWELKSSKDSSEGKNSDQSSETSESSDMEFNIASLSLIRTQINYSDATSKQNLSFTDVNLSAKKSQANVPVTVKGNVKFVSSDQNSIEMNIDTAFSYDESANKILLNGTILELKPLDSPKIIISTIANIDLNNSTVNLNPLTVGIQSLELTGDLSAQNFHDRPVLQGHLKSRAVNLKQLLSSYSSSFKLKDKKALNLVKLLGADVALSAEKFEMKNIDALVDGHTLSGRIDYSFSPSAHLEFNLQADDLNLEDYLPNTSGSDGKNKKASSENTNKAKAFYAEGSIALGRFTYGDYQISNLKTSLKYAAKQLDLQNFSGGIFGGRTSGNIHLNFNGNTSTLSIDQNMSGIRADDLLRSLTGSAKLTGVASVNLNLRANAGSGDAIKRSLSGSVSYSVNNGTITGTDIDYQVDQAIAKYTQRKATLSNRGMTPFSRLSGSTSISSGQTKTPNLELLTPTLKVQSAGSLNLVNNGIDYKLNCRLLQPQKISTEYLGTKINGDLSNYDIPARVGCTLQNPCVSVDLAGVLKILATEGAKAAAKTVIEKQLLKNVNPNVGKVLDQFFQKQ